MTDGPHASLRSQAPAKARTAVRSAGWTRSRLSRPRSDAPHRGAIPKLPDAHDGSILPVLRLGRFGSGGVARARAGPSGGAAAHGARGRKSRRPQTWTSRRRRRTSPPSSCIGCSWATSHCSAAIPRLPRAPISRRQRTPRMPGLPVGPPRSRLPPGNAAWRSTRPRLWAELDPAAERPKQVIAGLAGGAAGSGDPRRGSQGGSRAGAGGGRDDRTAAGRGVPAAQPGAGRRAGQGGDVEARAEPRAPVSEQFPRRSSPSRSPRTTRGSRISTRPRSRCRRSTVRSSLKPGWEQAMLLKVEILGKQSAERAADYLVEVLRTEPDSKIGELGAGAGSHPAEEVCGSGRDSAAPVGEGSGTITSTSSAWRCSRCR